MLKIALLGAPRTGKSLLASGLSHAANASAWPATIVVLKAQDPAGSAPPFAPTDYDLVLLTGLEDNGSTPTSSTPTNPQAQQIADTAIRTTLTNAKVAYRVLYGRNEERLAQACEALQSLLPTLPTRKKPTPWVWPCEKCSDPQCEHRLLTALLAQRSRRA